MVPRGWELGSGAVECPTLKKFEMLVKSEIPNNVVMNGVKKIGKIGKVKRSTGGWNQSVESGRLAQ